MLNFPDLLKVIDQKCFIFSLKCMYLFAGFAWLQSPISLQCLCRLLCALHIAVGWSWRLEYLGMETPVPPFTQNSASFVRFSVPCKVGSVLFCAVLLSYWTGQDIVTALSACLSRSQGLTAAKTHSFSKRLNSSSVKHWLTKSQWKKKSSSPLMADKHNRHSASSDCFNLLITTVGSQRLKYDLHIFSDTKSSPGALCCLDLFLSSVASHKSLVSEEGGFHRVGHLFAHYPRRMARQPDCFGCQSYCLSLEFPYDR